MAAAAAAVPRETLSKAECKAFLSLFEESMLESFRSKLLTLLSTVRPPLTTADVTVPAGLFPHQDAITVDTIKKGGMEPKDIWLLVSWVGVQRKRFTDAAADLLAPAQMLYQSAHAGRHGDRLPTPQEVDDLLSFPGWIGDVGERIASYRAAPTVAFLPEEEQTKVFIKQSVRLLCVLPSATKCLRPQDWLSLRSMKFKDMLIFSHDEVKVAATVRRISVANWPTVDKGFAIKFRRAVIDLIRDSQRDMVTIVFLSCKDGFQLPDLMLSELLRSSGKLDLFPSKIHLIFGGHFSQEEIELVRGSSDTSMSPFTCSSAHISQCCWALLGLAKSLGFAQCLDLPLALINAGGEHILPPTTTDDAKAAEDCEKFYRYQKTLSAWAAAVVPRRKVVTELLECIRGTPETMYRLTYNKPFDQPILHGMTTVVRHVLFSLVQESTDYSCLFIPAKDQSVDVCNDIIAFAREHSPRARGKLVVGVDRGVVGEQLLKLKPNFCNVVWIVVATTPTAIWGTSFNVHACLSELERAACMNHMSSLFDVFPKGFGDWQSYTDGSCSTKMPLVWAPLMLCQPVDGDRWVDSFLERAMNEIGATDRAELVRLALFQYITRGSGLTSVFFTFWNIDASPMNYIIHVFYGQVAKDNGCYCLTGDFVVRWLMDRVEHTPALLGQFAQSFAEEPDIDAVFSPTPWRVPHPQGRLVAICEKSSANAEQSFALVDAFVRASTWTSTLPCDRWEYVTAIVNAYTCSLKDEHKHIPRKLSIRSFECAVTAIGETDENAAVGLRATVQLRKFFWLRDDEEAGSSADVALTFKKAWDLFNILLGRLGSLPIFRMTGGFALVPHGSSFGYDEVTSLNFAVRLTEVLCFQSHSEFIRRQGQGVGNSICNALAKYVTCSGWPLQTGTAKELHVLLRVLHNQVQWPPTPLMLDRSEIDMVLSKDVWQSTSERQFSLAIASQYVALSVPLQTSIAWSPAAQLVYRRIANSAASARMLRVCPESTLFAFMSREKKWRIWTFASPADLWRPSNCIPLGGDVEGCFYFISNEGEKFYCRNDVTT